MTNNKCKLTGETPVCFGRDCENCKNDPARFADLPAGDQKTLLSWIADNLRPVKNVNPIHTSYGLKHLFGSDSRLYVNNGAFRGAMLEAGFTEHNTKSFNVKYKIGRIKPHKRF